MPRGAAMPRLPLHASSVNMFKNRIDKYLVKAVTHKIWESYT